MTSVSGKTKKAIKHKHEQKMHMLLVVFLTPSGDVDMDLKSSAQVYNALYQHSGINETLSAHTKDWVFQGAGVSSW